MLTYGSQPGYLQQRSPYSQQLTQPRQQQQQPSVLGSMPNPYTMMQMFGSSSPSTSATALQSAYGIDGAMGASSAGAGSGAASGGAGGMGALGPIAGIAALIAAGKTIEHNNPDSTYGRGLLSMLGPSANQIAADPKLGVTTALGIPFVNGWIRNDKAARVAPEWGGLFGMS